MKLSAFEIYHQIPLLLPHKVESSYDTIIGPYGAANNVVD